MQENLIRDLEDLLRLAKEDKLAGIVGVFFYTPEYSEHVTGGVLHAPCEAMKTKTVAEDGGKFTAVEMVERTLTRWAEPKPFGLNGG